MGWVNRRRDHGNLIFLDLRDRTGITQVVLDKEISPEAHAKAEAARPEYVVAVTGVLRTRGEGLANPNMATGDVEIVAHSLLLLNDARTPPFSPAEEAIANEEVRLKYRYLDLRRSEMQQNFAIRSRVAMAIRNYLVSQGFLEIETPFMTRSTPEGARDYLVPSRVHPGHFYALPQSPQIFKQILMVSGFDRYFQIARCFRDEDLRADRQPEFTQVDLEISFPQMSTIFAVTEGFLRAAFSAAGIELGSEPFLRMTYDQAIQRYGIDKPDMRLPAMVDLSAELTAELRATLKIDLALPVLGFTVPGVGELSGTARKALLSEIRAGFGDCGLDMLDVARLRTNPSFEPLAETIEARLSAEMMRFNGASHGAEDLAVVITPKPGTPKMWNYDPQWIYKRVGALRLELARKFADRHKLFQQTRTAADFKFLWVTDFPLFEWSDDQGRIVSAHHPFTMPHGEDWERIASDPLSVRSQAYDVVLNGVELASGSVRIHRPDWQRQIFGVLGLSQDEINTKFGFLVDAFQYGAPPHAGIAFGIDRLIMLMAGAKSLREVIAFPKTAKGSDPLMDAPSPVDSTQLHELGLKLDTP